jgi:hypothetical protein
MKFKRNKRSKPCKRNKPIKRQSKLLIKLSSWNSYIDEAYQLESLLAKKPKQLQIEFVGSGEIPADTALLMRSMILKRSPRTRIITNARSSLIGPTVLVWLMGDIRHLREDAQLRFRPSGPFGGQDAPVAWRDRCTCDECEIDEQNYIRVLHAINQFLPVNELAGQQIEIAVLKQFGLVENEKVDTFLAAAFGRDKERGEKQRPSRSKEPAKEAAT